MTKRDAVFAQLAIACNSLPHTSIKDVMYLAYMLKWGYPSHGKQLRAARNVPSFAKLNDDELLQCLTHYNRVKKNENKTDRGASTQASKQDLQEASNTSPDNCTKPFRIKQYTCFHPRDRG